LNRQRNDGQPGSGKTGRLGRGGGGIRFGPERPQPPAEWLLNGPKFIPNPNAVKSADWGDDIHGQWEPPTVVNPKGEAAAERGEYEAPVIKNPSYKGKWRPPMIKNPLYRNSNSPLHRIASKKSEFFFF
jgi:hypothetical protein